MDMHIFDHMNAAELRTYLTFLLRHYRIMDSFWFIYINEMFDQPTAELLNEKVWERVSGMAAQELVEKFNIREKGLAGFVKAQKMYPWSVLIGYEFTEKDDEVILSVPSCPTQKARLKRGLGEYHCKEMHKKEFINFAKAIDERIRVECRFAPPDTHPDNMFCQWRFYLEDD